MQKQFESKKSVNPAPVSAVIMLVLFFGLGRPAVAEEAAEDKSRNLQTTVQVNSGITARRESASDQSPGMPGGFKATKNVVSLLELKGDFEQTRALYELIGNSDVQALKQHLVDVEDIPSPGERRAATQVIFLRFSELDGESALDHLLHSKFADRNTLLQIMFSNWAKYELEFAIEQVALLQDHTHQRIATHTILSTLDTEGEEGLLELAARLPYAEEVAPSVFRRFSQNDMANPQAALQKALKITDRNKRLGALYTLAQKWVAHDLPAATAQVSQIKNQQDRRVFQDAIFSWQARQNPERLLASLDQYKDAKVRHSLVQQALAALSSQDLSKAFTAANRLPAGALRDQALSQTIHSWISRDPAVVAELLAGLDSPAVDQQILRQLASEYARRDPVAALAWAEHTEGRRGSLWIAAVNAMAVENPVDAFELMATLEPSNEQLQAMSNLLGKIADTDPLFALDLYDNMPPGRASAGTASAIAYNMAKNEPELAMAWALGLPVAVQDQMMRQLANVMAQHGVEVASAYLDQLETPELQDQWMDSLVNHYARENPVAAWQWLQAYADYPKYGRWMGVVVQNIAQKDPAKAITYLQEMDGDPHYATTLSAVLRVWALKDGKAAARYLDQLKYTENRPLLIRNVTQSWVNYDPKGAERWVLRLIHSDERDAGLSAILRPAMYMKDSHIRRLLDRYISEEQRAAATYSLVNKMARSDPKRAEFWIDSSYINDSQRTRLQQIIDRPPGV